MRISLLKPRFDISSLFKNVAFDFLNVCGFVLVVCVCFVFVICWKFKANPCLSGVSNGKKKILHQFTLFVVAYCNLFLQFAPNSNAIKTQYAQSHSNGCKNPRRTKKQVKKKCLCHYHNQAIIFCVHSESGAHIQHKPSLCPQTEIH